MFFSSYKWKLDNFISLFLCLAISFIGGGCNAFSEAKSDETIAQTGNKAIALDRVVALGKIVPKGEVIKLSVTNAEDSRVNQILVEEGDRVVEGQVIAVLQGIDRKTRDLEEAKKAVEFYRAKLAQIKAGDAKNAEIAGQKANIARLESQSINETAQRQAAISSAIAQLRQAELTYKRNQTLRQDRAISQQELDLALEKLELSKATLTEKQAELNNTVQTLEQEIAREKENLAQLNEVRPVDIRVAEAELERALVAVEQTQADVEDTKVKVPIAGQILRINTRVGEQVNIQQGIVELGQTDRMYAIAEVYETDITQVKVGQEAIITSEYGGLKEDVRGVVEHIGLQIGSQTTAQSATDPTQDKNTRVVEVKIRINEEDSPKVSALTNMQVRVEIDTE